MWAVVVAGGVGSRFGGAKQWALLAGRPVATWSVEAARQVCDGVVLVADPDRGALGADTVVAGGDSRARSVRAGLAAVPADAAVVVVHDAARPLARPALFRTVVAAVTDTVAGAVPGLAVTDTLKRLAGGREPPAPVAATVDRRGLVAVQTPQAFRAEVLRAAHRAEGEGTDDAALVEQAGAVVVVVPGDPANVKITTPDDLVVAEALLARRLPDAG